MFSTVPIQVHNELTMKTVICSQSLNAIIVDVLCLSSVISRKQHLVNLLLELKFRYIVEYTAYATDTQKTAQGPIIKREQNKMYV